MPRALALSRRIGACLLALSLALAAGEAPLAAAVDLGAPMPRAAPVDPADVRAHISSVLRGFMEAPHAGAIDARLKRMTAAAAAPDRVVLRLDGDTSAATLIAIGATGAVVRSVSTRFNDIVIEATLDQVEAVARIGGVRSVHLAYRPIRRTAPTPDASDGVIHTNQVRSQYGVNGSGRKIGIISDSIDMSSYVGGPDTTHAMGSAFAMTGTPPQSAGVLPATVQVVYQSNPSDTALGGNTDEGEAMMENCYSLAPGAGFYFGAANDTDTEMATAISKLSTAGCNVICDDIGFPDEPMFQDGPIAQACETFIGAGGVYCSAAGNDADAGTFMPFVDVVPGANDVQSNGTPNPNDIHNWGIGGATPGFLPLVIQGDDALSVTLEWNQPYQSYGLGAGSQADFDLYITSGTSFNNVIGHSSDTQGTLGHPSGDAVENAFYVNPSPNPTTVYLAIDHVRGITTSLLRLEYHTEFGLSSPFYSTVLGKATLFGHPAAIDVLGVAAVPVTSPSTPETFTAKGGWGANGLPFYFDTTGNALPGAPVLRNKPDVAAPDGNSTAAPNFTPFFGTSDATPQVAAAVAVAWSARPSLTNTQLINGFRGTAVDITAAPSVAGPDDRTGFGLIDAYTAAGVPITGITTASTGTLATGTVTITMTFAAAVTVTGTPTILLNTTPARAATYVSGSGTTTLTFSYAIQNGDVSAALAPASIQALQLPGGATIVDGSANPADLALPPASGVATGAAADIGTVAIDAVGPSVAIVPTPAVSNHPSFSFAITFSHAVTSFVAGNCTLTNCTAGALTTNTAGLSYTLAVTASAPGTLTVAVPANAVQDSNTLGNLAGSGSATYDITPPTLVISGLATMQSNSTALYTFTWSKSVSGFTVGDIGVAGGATSGALGGSGAVYTVNVASGPAGTMVITVAPNAGITDAAGNAFAAGASLQVSVDNPTASNKHCGLGSIGVILPMLWWMNRRRRARSRA